MIEIDYAAINERMGRALGVGPVAGTWRDYYTSPAAAWSAVERMGELGHPCTIRTPDERTPTYYVAFRPHYLGHGSTFPVAVCAAVEAWAAATGAGKDERLADHIADADKMG